MASTTLRKLFRDVRKSDVGFCVSPAVPYQMRSAAILRKWQVLEDIGAVRLIAEVDQDWEPDCDCDDPSCSSKNPESEAFGSLGQYRTDFGNLDGDGCWDWYSGDVEDDSLPWETAGSVWGHVGYKDVLDWRENCYILGIMSETIDAFRDAWKAHVRSERERRAGVCPTCHGTGKAS